jgi:transcription antitermination factor NusG
LVERLMAQADADGIVLPYKAAPRFAAGDHVRVLCGPFEGAFGAVAKVNGHHLGVALTLFSRETVVFLRSEQVERVS